jgi:hypothetical protein
MHRQTLILWLTDIAGFTGFTGATGATGDTGFTGATGFTGDTGTDAYMHMGETTNIMSSESPMQKGLWGRL